VLGGHAATQVAEEAGIWAMSAQHHAASSQYRKCVPKSDGLCMMSETALVVRMAPTTCPYATAAAAWNSS